MHNFEFNWETSTSHVIKLCTADEPPGTYRRKNCEESDKNVQNLSSFQPYMVRAGWGQLTKPISLIRGRRELQPSARPIDSAPACSTKHRTSPFIQPEVMRNSLKYPNGTYATLHHLSFILLVFRWKQLNAFLVLTIILLWTFLSKKMSYLLLTD